MRRILKLAYTDQNIRRLAESIGEIEAEMDRGIGGRRPEFRESALAKDLLEQLAADKAALVQEAGARARGKLEYERDSAADLARAGAPDPDRGVAQGARGARGLAREGQPGRVVRDLKYSTAVSDEHLYWPYEGEFWRDELGTYSYTLTKGCKDRLPRGPAPRPGKQSGRGASSMQRALVAGVALALGASTAGAASPRRRRARPTSARSARSRRTPPSAARSRRRSPGAKEAGPALEFEAFRKTIEVQVSDKRREEIARSASSSISAAAPRRRCRSGTSASPSSSGRSRSTSSSRRTGATIELIALGTAATRARASGSRRRRRTSRPVAQAAGRRRSRSTRRSSRSTRSTRASTRCSTSSPRTSRSGPHDPDALKAYRALIERYPNSRYVPDAWMAFGEYYFEKANKADRPAT